MKPIKIKKLKLKHEIHHTLLFSTIGVVFLCAFLLAVFYAVTKEKDQSQSSDQVSSALAYEVYNDPCDRFTRTIDIASCKEKEFNQEELIRKKLYKEIIDTLDGFIKKNNSDSSAYKKLKESFVSSEKSWVNYRESYCTSQTGIGIYSSKDLPIGGSGAQMEYPTCMAELTKEHINQLQHVYDKWLLY